jgi:ribosomal protein S25
VSVEDDERSGRPSTSKTTENVERIQELVNEDRHQTMHELADTVGISYGVCQEILTENLNMSCIAPSSRHCAHPHFLKTTEFVTNSNMVIVPHPPYSPDSAPCDFTLFSKLKMKLTGRHFETVSVIQRESQAVLDSIKENDFCF